MSHMSAHLMSQAGTLVSLTQSSIFLTAWAAASNERLELHYPDLCWPDWACQVSLH